MWRVITVFQNRAGEITEMNYLKKGDRFEAIHSAMASMSIPNDEWVTLVAIHIERVES